MRGGGEEEGPQRGSGERGWRDLPRWGERGIGGGRGGGGFEVLSFSLYLTIVVQSNVPQSTDKDLCIV